jgi:1-deoxy-D-xylulose-5-phosphate synthase
LAEELRRRITAVVGEKGGHLSSNLGIVELTIALHRAFDFSRDRLVLDVGHQCYPHKLLTGRGERFGSLRSKGGVSGFPSPRESPYDLFVTGHASTAISTALGLACAEPGGSSRRVVAVIGDGAISGGLAFEGLNLAGHMGRDLLVILNDNEMAISRTVGALSRHLSRLRVDPRYNELRNELGAVFGRLPFLGEVGKKLVDLARRAVSPGGVFQDFGFRYIGPVDGHEVTELESTLARARELTGPVLLHVYTQKGRGYGPAAADPAGYHSAPPFKVRVNDDYAAGRAPGAEPPPTYSDVMARALRDLGRKDGRVVAVTAAMPDGTGLAECARAWPDRCFDVGICEAHAVTFAAGLARGGRRPVVAVYSTFLQRALDSVFHDVCLQEDLGVVLCVDRAGLVGSDGPTHHGLYDIAFLRSLPGVVLAAPRDGPELEAMLAWAVGLGRPVAIRYPRARVPEPAGPVPPVELGRAELLEQGERVALVAYGASVAEARAALRILGGEGIRVTLVNARFAKPVDEGLLARLAASHERIVTVEEGALAGGFGSAVMEAAERAGWDPGMVTRLGVGDRFVAHASREEQLAECGLDSEGVARAVRAVFQGRGAGANG